MSEEVLITHGSATLAGLKTASLVSVPREDAQSLLASVRGLNHRLVPRGLRLVVVRQTQRRVLIYVYRPQRLLRDLEDPLAREMLLSRGYPLATVEQAVAHLVRRLRMCDDFPHEIGLFLGYPARDVAGFLADSAHPKYTGVWKVYDDVDAARRLFAQFAKCSRLYREVYRRTGSLDRLIVRSP